MMNAEIFIMGATGNVGSEVVRNLKNQGIAFRAGFTDITAPRLEPHPLMEAVSFDFRKPTTHLPAFAGMKSLFLVRPPRLANVQRDLAPAIRTAIMSGVEQIVFLSLQGVEQHPITPHHKIEKLILASGVHYTFLRAGFFMQNLSTIHAAEIRERGEIALPVGQAKTAFIDVRDIAAVAVCALTDPQHLNKKYTLTGNEALDYDQVASILSEVLKRQIRYTRPSALQFIWRQLVAGQSPGYTLLMTWLYTLTRSGNAQEVSTDVEGVLQRRPVSFERFARDYQQSWQP
jgi:uncharacterized protein YbjT (DUF2867 family)